MEREISLLCQTMVWTLISSEDKVQITYEVEGGLDLLSPDGFSGTTQDVISGKIRVGRSQAHYWESRFRQDADLWRRNWK